ncbi:MAG: MoaD/ThiS family protein [Actinomycetota bacterium]
MSVVVAIPTQLRGLTGGSAEVQATGGTIAEIFADLSAAHPGISERLFDEAGSLRRFVNVYVDDENVRFLDGLSTPVTEGSRVSIIPAVAGGAF